MKVSKVNRRILNTPITGEQIYLFAFCFYFILAFLQTTTYIAYISENASQKLSLIAVVLLLIKIFIYDKNSLKSFIINILALGFLVVVWRTSHDVKFFSLGMFVLGARNVNFKKVIYLYLSIGTIFLIFTIGSSLSGLIKNLIYYRGTDTRIVRQSLGILYPTDFAAHVLFLFLAYLYLRFDKISVLDYLALIITAIIVTIVCNARLNVYALLLIIPVFFIGKRAKNGKVISSFIASFYWTIPTIAAYLIIALTFFYDQSNKLMLKFNHLLSDRLKYGSEAFRRYGTSLLGQHVQEHGWGGLGGQNMADHSMMNRYFFIDSSFLRLFIIYGIIVTVVVLIIMTVIVRRSVQNNSYALASVMVIVTVSAIVEQHLLDLSYDPFLIALLANTSLPLFNTKGWRKKSEKLHS